MRQSRFLSYRNRLHYYSRWKDIFTTCILYNYIQTKQQPMYVHEVSIDVLLGLFRALPRLFDIEAERV